jgi:hypothetical protein
LLLKVVLCYTTSDFTLLFCLYVGEIREHPTYIDD